MMRTYSSIISDATPELLIQPANAKERKPYDRQRHISRDFPWQQDEPKNDAWNSLPEAERRAKEREGIAAWKAWVEKHQGAIVAMGGPLGKTKKITQRGIEDISNEMGAFTVVRAESNEAAAKLFENHPHFTIFPGEAVEVMPVLPIPGG